MTSKIPLVEGSKFYMTVTDGKSYLVVESPDDYKPEEGEIVRVYLNAVKYHMIAFYTHRRGNTATTGLDGIGELSINTIGLHDDFTFSPASQEDKTLLLTALADAGYQYNEETHEVEKIRWRPKRRENYWTFNAKSIFKTINAGLDMDIERINNGLIFKTQQEAQEFFDKVKQMANEYK